jgi:hypothetical protein
VSERPAPNPARRPIQRLPGWRSSFRWPKRAAAELREHPIETAALVSMLAALLRLGGKRSGKSPERWRAPLLPLGLMAAICLLGLATCVTPAAALDLDHVSASARS